VTCFARVHLRGDRGRRRGSSARWYLEPEGLERVDRGGRSRPVWLFAGDRADVRADSCTQKLATGPRKAQHELRRVCLDRLCAGGAETVRCGRRHQRVCTATSIAPPVVGDQQGE